MAEKRWQLRPEGSNWGDFGPDDQLGRMNLLTREKVLQGMAEVRSGRTFCLSLPLDMPGGNILNPNRYPPVLRPTKRNGLVNFNCLLGETTPGRTDVMSDDLVVLHLQYSTQWDGFAHAGGQFDVNGDGIPEAVYYNGFRAGFDVVGPVDLNDCGAPTRPGTGQSTSSAKALGIETMAQTCVQGRAVLIDLQHHLGNARSMVGYDTLARIMRADGVVIEPGDMVCLHTGFGQMLMDANRQPSQEMLENSCAVLDGRDPQLLQWITDSGMAALIADNYAVEGLPARDGGDCCAALPLHEHCLFKLGVHLGELWYLTELAACLRSEGRNRFLLTAPPLNLPGAIGSPATPVATI